jgi:hypothetical protein
MINSPYQDRCKIFELYQYLNYLFSLFHFCYLDTIQKYLMLIILFQHSPIFLIVISGLQYKRLF